MDAIKHRELNIVFLGPVITNDPTINSTILFEETLDALLPYNHPLAQKNHIDLYELRNEPFILFPRDFRRAGTKRL